MGGATNRYPGTFRMLNKLWLGFFIPRRRPFCHRWLAIGDPRSSA